MPWDDDENMQSADEANTGSDELLADDNLRLPESASILVRIHAVRAWLARRLREVEEEIGEEALEMQLAMREAEEFSITRPRRRGSVNERLQRAQQALSVVQEKLRGYEEAQKLFEECVDHVTAGGRVLVEYYLMLDNLLLDLRTRAEQSVQDEQGVMNHAPTYLGAIADVQHRIEYVVTPEEE